MKRNFIYSKKSVRTFKLRIEPSFLSHAERGEPFQIQDFLGGIHLCRHFVPTPIRLQNAISISGGVCWTKFETISSKIQMIKNTNADSAGRNNLSGGKDSPCLGCFPAHRRGLGRNAGGFRIRDFRKFGG